MSQSVARATLATVAASAGVSVATVSKVLNGRTDVAPETRARVQSLLQEHEYVVRRTERTAQSTVELVFEGQLNAYSTDVLQGVVDAAADAGVAVVVSVRHAEPGKSGAATTWARERVAARRHAIIAVTSRLTSAELGVLSRARLPLVVIDPLNLPQASVTSVGSTNFAGGMAATAHLLGLGHRRIGYCGGLETASCNQARMLGFRGALEAAGAALRSEHVRSGRFRFEDGFVGGGQLLDLPVPPTAVFAASDEVAVGVLEAARARGLRVPDDLSVVGFDDTQLARVSSPPLTTVRQPLRRMGAMAMRTALRLAAGEPIDSHHVELATELVVRSSTAPVRSDD